MRAHVITTFIAISMGVGSLAPLAAAQDKKPCTNMSRACLIEVARAYIDARADGHAQPLMRLAPNIHGGENGLLTAENPSEIAGPPAGVVSKTVAARDVNRVLI